MNADFVSADRELDQLEGVLDRMFNKWIDSCPEEWQDELVEYLTLIKVSFIPLQWTVTGHAKIVGVDNGELVFQKMKDFTEEELSSAH